MRLRRIVLHLLVVLCLGGSVVARADPLDVRDDRGITHRFDRPARRIVSLLPSITESVCALGACDRLVGVDRYSNVPAEVLSLPRLGGLDDIQVERIVVLRPDVVLAARSARATARLEDLGIAVLNLDSDTQADVHRSLRTIALLLGTPSAADRVEAGIARDMAAAAARVPQALRGRSVYFEIGSAPYAAGAASFIGETLARIGLANMVPAAMGAFPKLNPEFVIRNQPDIVMAGQRDLATMPARPGWDRLRAIAEGRTCGFDAVHYELLTRPGPRLGEAALAMADCLAALPRLPAAAR